MRKRFSLSALLMLVTVCCVWLGYRTNQATVQRHAVNAVREAGGSVRYDHEQDGPNGPVRPAPGTLERLFGIDFFHHVVDVRLSGNVGLDELMPVVTRLPELKELWLGESDVTDDGIKHISKCRQLTHLSVCGTGIGDSALMVVGKVDSLHYLDLATTKTTNQGLQHLSPLSNLEELYLWGEHWTDEAMLHVSTLTGLKQLHIQHCSVTTEGLSQVAGLPNLKALNISPANFDDGAIDVINKLDKLEWLILDETGVSDAAIAELKRARPTLSVH